MSKFRLLKESESVLFYLRDESSISFFWGASFGQSATKRSFVSVTTAASSAASIAYIARLRISSFSLRINENFKRKWRIIFAAQLCCDRLISERRLIDTISRWHCTIHRWIAERFSRWQETPSAQAKIDYATFLRFFATAKLAEEVLICVKTD